MPTSAAHGKHGAAKAAGATLPVRKWSAEHEAPEVDVTNTTSNGWQELLDGGAVHKVTGSIEMVLDPSNPQYLDPPNLRAGVIVALELTINVEAGRKWTGNGYITKAAPAEIDPTNEDAILFKIDFSSTGAWTFA